MVQYDSIYRVTARAQGVPATRSDDGEGGGTHARVLGSEWQLALYFIYYIMTAVLIVLFAATKPRLVPIVREGGSLVKPLGPRIEQLTQTLSRGPRLVPGLSSANGRFVFIAVEPDPNEKDGPRAMPPFSRLFSWLSQVGTP